MSRPLPSGPRAYPFAVAVLSCLWLVSCREASGPQQRAITISPSGAELLVGGTQQFTAQGATGPSTWTSDNEAVATVVRQTGFVTATGRGSTMITAENGGVSATVQVTVLAPALLVLSVDQLAFEMLAGAANPAPATVSVANAGDAPLTGVAAGDIEWAPGQPQNWLGVALSGSAAPLTVTVTPQAAALPPGTYTASLPIAANVANSPQRVAVSLVVRRPATIQLSRSTVALQGIPGVTLAETVGIANVGDVPLTGLATTITYGSGSNWLATSLSTTSAPATMTLTTNTTGLAPGTYTATVRVSSSIQGVAAADVAVTLTVQPTPALLPNPTALQFAVAPNGTQQQAVALTSSTVVQVQGLAAAVTYTGGGAQNWLAAAVAAQSTPTSLNVGVNADGLAPGTYGAVVRVTSTTPGVAPLDIPIQLTVTQLPAIAFSVPAVSVGTQVGVNPAGASVNVVNSGGGSLTGLSVQGVTYTSGSNWLAAALAGTTAPATLNLSFSAAGLAPGTYTASVAVGSPVASNAPQLLPVTLTVTQSIALAATPTSVTFPSLPTGSSTGQSVSITSTGGTATGLSHAVSYLNGTGGWLNPVINTAATPAVMSLTVNTAGLAPGSYTASVRVSTTTPGVASLDIPVSMTVVQQPAMAVTPTSLTFGGWRNGTQPAQQVVQVTNTGGGTLAGLTATANAGWLTVSVPSPLSITNNVATFTVRPNTTNLTAGTYNAVVTVTSSTPGVASRSVNVQYVVSSFEAHIQPLLTQANCATSGCHSASHPTLRLAGTAQQNHAALVPFSPHSDPNRELRCKIFGACGHSGGKFTGISNFQTLVNAWIGAGAPF